MRVLIVEDDVKIAKALKQGLEQESYAVDMVHDGDDGLAYATTEDYDAIILDRMLPGSYDGVQILEELRKEGSSIPTLMLTARTTVKDKISGLDAGADDYLAKPFDFDELLARLRALLRRPSTQEASIIKIADLEIDLNQQTAARAGTELDLTKKEFGVLEYLARHKGKLVSKDQLMQHVWDFDADILPNTVEAYIGYVRKKVDKPFPDSPCLIHTKRGFGYKLEVAE